jgi:hypothetical protein
MLKHHPEKFDKDSDGEKDGKMNPYALAWSMKKKGGEAHYKDQKSSKEGEPEKKEKFKDEDKKDEGTSLWQQWKTMRENGSEKQ